MRHILTVVTILALFMALATTAVAQDDLPPIQRTDPGAPYVPKKAKVMTIFIAMAAAEIKARAEQADTSKWPANTYHSVYNCKVTSKHRGRCDYRIYFVDASGLHRTTCTRRVVTTIAKKTHRVRSSRRSLGCETS